MPRRPNILFYDGYVAHLGVHDEAGVREMVTTPLHPGRYVRIDDGLDYPQLCAGGLRQGSTLSVADDPARIAEELARDCAARLYRTRAGYDGALARLRAGNPGLGG